MEITDTITNTICMKNGSVEQITIDTNNTRLCIYGMEINNLIIEDNIHTKVDVIDVEGGKKSIIHNIKKKANANVEIRHMVFK